MQEFTIPQDGLKKIKKQALARTVPITIIAMGVGIAISQVRIQQSDSSFWMAIIPLFGVMIIASFFMAGRRIEAIFKGYSLTISNGSVTREQGLTPPLTLTQADIKEIIKNKNGSITIKAVNAAHSIGIPAQISNIQQLESELQQIIPIIEKPRQALLERYGMLAGLPTLALMALVFISENKVVVGISGTLLTSFLIWSFFQIVKNKSIDSKTKRSGYWLIPVLFSVIGVTVLKLIR